MYFSKKIFCTFLLLSSINIYAHDSDVYNLNFKEKALLSAITVIDSYKLVKGEEGIFASSDRPTENVYAVMDAFIKNSLAAEEKYKNGAIIAFTLKSINKDNRGIYFEFDPVNQAAVGASLATAQMFGAYGMLADPQVYSLHFITRAYLADGFIEYAKNYRDNAAWLTCKVEKSFGFYEFNSCLPNDKIYVDNYINPIKNYLSTKKSKSEREVNLTVRFLTMASLVPPDSACFKKPLKRDMCLTSINNTLKNKNLFQSKQQEIISKLNKLNYQISIGD